jgi:alpha-L-rhamnosidase
MELTGWDMPDYDASVWSSVDVQPRMSVPALVADRAEPVRVTKHLAPRSITQVGDAYVCDMGQNMVGWVRLRAQGAAGTQITLRFTEMANPDGTVYTENLRAARQTDVFILKGNRVEVFEPHFTFHGFRYVEITGYPGVPTVEDVVGCVVHSDAPLAGSFTCSNPMINQLAQNIQWGQRGNFLSVPTDCPQRDERLGWLGDAQVFARTATYNMDVAAFFTKWLVDIEDAQAFSGAFPNVVPKLARLEDGAPAWADAGVIIPYTVYLMYGDTRILERCWNGMVRWMEYLQQANPGHLWIGRRTRNYGDWLSINADTPKDLLATAYYAYDAALMAKIAEVLGRSNDAEKYRSLFEAIKIAFIRAYVEPDGRIKGNTQTAYVLALHMNLLPDELRAAAALYLVEDILAKGGHLSTGFIGVSYLCPTLEANGYPDIAYRLLTNETFPSWGYSIKQGATTIWERWDGWTEDKGFQTPKMNSFNHYSLGSIGQWLFQAVAGIEPEKAGFEHIRLRPRIGGGLTHVQAEYNSIRGKIRVHWQVDEDVLTLNVTVPANATATLFLPARSVDDVTESGLPIGQVLGVSFLHQEGVTSVFALLSGDYTFSSHWR